MVGPGWYDDPLVPGGKRWWTGQSWTEETREPSTGGGWASGKTPTEPAPWVPGGATRAAPDVALGDPWALKPVGQWLSRSFRAVAAHAGPLLSLYCVLPVALVGAGYIALRSVLSDAVIFFGDDPSVDGLGVASGVLAVVDLANCYTVSALLTEDRAVQRDAGFEVLGRLSQAELRGCNFLLEKSL